MAVDWCAVRAEFPALQSWTFLNSATYGQTPRRANEAIARHLAHRDELACADFLNWFDDTDRIRHGIGRLVGCTAHDIAFITTASQALSLLIAGIDWRAGDRVVTLEGEFPNNQYYPALLGEHGVEFVETSWEAFEQAVTPRTRLVALSSVNYSSGFRAPLEEVGAFLRDRGILFYVDGTQSVGALRMDLKRIRPAMMAVDAYKWMLTPNGAGFLYVAPDTRQWLKPQTIGWRSHHDWRSVDRLHQGIPEFSPNAERYEGGMLPFPTLYAMGAVVRWMLEIGPDAIEERVTALAAELRRRLPALEGRHYDSPVVAARWEGVDVSALARSLREQKVLVSARLGSLRVSAHFYNDESDIDRLCTELARLGVACRP